MATHTFVHFEDPEGFELARLASIKFDLESTVALCDSLSAKISASESGFAEPELTDAFSTAIVVRYNRAFVKGARHGLHEDELNVLTEDQRAEHQRFRLLRDKHFAHSVNGMEDTRVQARYCLERVAQEGITGVSTAHYRVYGLSSQDVAVVKDLCEKFLRCIESREKEEKTRLLAVIRTLPIERVLAGRSSPLLGSQTVPVEKRRPRP